MAKLLVEKHVPTYLYVLNTTVEALRLPQWRRVSHNTELLWLTGAPFMDVGKFVHTSFSLSNIINELLFFSEFFPQKWNLKRDMWTDNDRNMSHFFMKAYANFATYG